MYLCICNAHRLEDVRAAAISTGAESAAEVYAALGGPPRCGRCLPRAQETINAIRSECCGGTSAATGCCQEERGAIAAPARALALVEA
jgi:bacterioferritin-associated ferredoxin